MSTTTATLSFREIVRLIHPDSNPGVDNAGEMMAIAKRHRKDQSFLYELAVHWGIVKPTKEVKDEYTPPPPQKEVSAPSKEPNETVVSEVVADAKSKIDEKRKNENNSNAFVWDTDSIAEAEKQRKEWYQFRVRNRIFAPGDIIYVRTRKEYVKIAKIGNNRVYFDWNGRQSYAIPKNVRHAGWRIQNEASQSL